MRLVYIAKDKSSILLQISKTTTLPPMRNSRTLVAVVNKSSILLRISKITALPPTRNSRTLTAVAKMSFALKPIYNSTTMRNTQSKYSFVLLVCMHVTAFLVFPISHFLSFTQEAQAFQSLKEKLNTLIHINFIVFFLSFPSDFKIKWIQPSLIISSPTL